jgi:hypothetical protein
MATTKAATTETRSGFAITSGAGNNCLGFQLVSDPLDAQTITGGTVTVVMRGRELAATDNVNKRWRKVYVVSNDGSTVRGTLVSMAASASTTELGTSLAGTVMALNAGTGTLAVSAGDRIVVEVGYGMDATGTTPQADMVIGGNGTDHTTTEGDTTGTVAWVEFSQTLTFQSPVQNGDAALTAGSSLSAAGTRGQFGSASLTAAASLTVAAVRQQFGSAPLTAAASLGASGTVSGPTHTLFGLSYPPAGSGGTQDLTGTTDSFKYILGTHFRVLVNGTITAIYFYVPTSIPTNTDFAVGLVKVNAGNTWLAWESKTKPVSGQASTWVRYALNSPISVTTTDELYAVVRTDRYAFSGQIFASDRTNGDSTLVGPADTGTYPNGGFEDTGVATDPPTWSPSSFDVSFYGIDPELTTASGPATVNGSAALTAGASLSASGLVTKLGTAALTASASLSASGVVTRLGTADLTASAQLAVAGIVTQLGTAVLTAGASLSTTGVVSKAGSAPLTASSALAVSGLASTAPIIEATGLSIIGGAGATSIGPLTPPVEAVAGKRLLAVVTWRGQGTIAPSEAGWSELFDLSVTGGPTTAVYERPIAGGDPSAYTFTFSGSASRVMVTFAVILGANGAPEASAQNSGTSLSFDSPDVTALGANRMLVRIWARANLDTLSGFPPAGETSAWVNATGGAAGGYAEQYGATEVVGAGVVGVDSLTITGTARGWEAFSLVYAPVSTGSITGSADLAASAALSAAGTVSRVGSAPLTASAALSAAGVVTRLGTVDLSATAQLAVFGVVTKPGTAALAAVATLNAAATRTVLGSAPIVASSTLTVTGTIAGQTAADLVATAALVVSGQRTAIAVASLTAGSSLVTSGLRTAISAASLSASSSLSVSGVVVQLGVVTLIASATLIVSGTVAGTTTADLVAVSTLSTSAIRGQLGSAQLTAAANLAAAGVVSRSGAVALLAAASLAAAGRLDARGTAVLVATAALSASSFPLVNGSAALRATSLLSIIGYVHTPLFVGTARVTARRNSGGSARTSIPTSAKVTVRKGAT